MKLYWHELSKEEYDKIIKSEMTIQDALDKYSQPDWCGYPDALAGMWGCWSLTGENRIKISKEFCKDCECNKLNDQK